MRGYVVLRDAQRRTRRVHAVLDEDYWAVGESLGTALGTACWRTAHTYVGEFDPAGADACPKCVAATAGARVAV